MGFLDRMVSDLVKSSTGYNVRPLVRMIGAKRLLTLGGAAVAGAALTDRLKQQAARPGTPPPGAVPPVRPAQPVPPPAPPGAVPPPPPGVPASAPPSVAPPPLPPQSTAPPPAVPAAPMAPPPPPPDAVVSGGDAEAEMSAALTLAGVRTVIAAALADGTLAEAERTVIDEHLARPELSPDQADQARADLDDPVSPETLATLVNNVAEAEVVYRLAAAVMLADDTVTLEERAWLDAFAEALGFEDQVKTAIESSLVFGR